MSIKCRPVFSLLLAATVCLPSAFCQGLPATNMGKFVHQPGDNQYQPSSQVIRHGDAPGSYLDVTGCDDHRTVIQRQAAAQQQAAMPAYTLAPPPPPGPDVSIEAIAAEEPVPPAGFPPLPLALDLPVTMGFGSVGHGTWKNGGGGSGGGGGGGSAGGPNPFQGEHGGTAGGPGYGHYQAGAFVAKKNNMGGGGGDDGGSGGGDDGSGGGGGNGGGNGLSTITSPAISPGSNNNSAEVRSGYKVRTPPPIMRTDTFSNTTSGGTGKGAREAPTMTASHGSGGGGPSGKAPTLDDKEDGAGPGAPEAPTATGVFQTKAEDLTLPDDEYTSRYFKDGKGHPMVRQKLKQAKSMGRSMLRQTGVPIGF